MKIEGFTPSAPYSPLTTPTSELGFWESDSDMVDSGLSALDQYYSEPPETPAEDDQGLQTMVAPSEQAPHAYADPSLTLTSTHDQQELTITNHNDQDMPIDHQQDLSSIASQQQLSSTDHNPVMAVTDEKPAFTNDTDKEMLEQASAITHDTDEETLDKALDTVHDTDKPGISPSTPVNIHEPSAVEPLGGEIDPPPVTISKQESDRLIDAVNVVPVQPSHDEIATNHPSPQFEMLHFSIFSISPLETHVICPSSAGRRSDGVDTTPGSDLDTRDSTVVQESTAIVEEEEANPVLSFRQEVEVAASTEHSQETSPNEVIIALFHGGRDEAITSSSSAAIQDQGDFSSTVPQAPPLSMDEILVRLRDPHALTSASPPPVAAPVSSLLHELAEVASEQPPIITAELQEQQLDSTSISKPSSISVDTGSSDIQRRRDSASAPFNVKADISLEDDSADATTPVNTALGERPNEDADMTMADEPLQNADMSPEHVFAAQQILQSESITAKDETLGTAATTEVTTADVTTVITEDVAGAAETTVSENAVEVNAVRDIAIPSTVAQDEMMQDSNSQDNTAQENSEHEQDSTEQASTEQVGTEQAGNKQADTEQIDNEQAHTQLVNNDQANTQLVNNEQAVTEQAVTEQAVTERAVTEQADDEQASTQLVNNDQANTDQANIGQEQEEMGDSLADDTTMADAGAEDTTAPRSSARSAATEESTIIVDTAHEATAQDDEASPLSKQGSHRSKKSKRTSPFAPGEEREFDIEPSTRTGRSQEAKPWKCVMAGCLKSYTRPHDVARHIRGFHAPHTAVLRDQKLYVSLPAASKKSATASAAAKPTDSPAAEDGLFPGPAALPPPASSLADASQDGTAEQDQQPQTGTEPDAVPSAIPEPWISAAVLSPTATRAARSTRRNSAPAALAAAAAQSPEQAAATTHSNDAAATSNDAAGGASGAATEQQAAAAPPPDPKPQLRAAVPNPTATRAARGTKRKAAPADASPTAAHAAANPDAVQSGGAAAQQRQRTEPDAALSAGAEPRAGPPARRAARGTKRKVEAVEGAAAAASAAPAIPRDERAAGAAGAAHGAEGAGQVEVEAEGGGERESKRPRSQRRRSLIVGRAKGGKRRR